jgi:hypothetical protein
VYRDKPNSGDNMAALVLDIKEIINLYHHLENEGLVVVPWSSSCCSSSSHSGGTDPCKKLKAERRKTCRSSKGSTSLSFGESVA